MGKSHRATRMIRDLKRVTHDIKNERSENSHSMTEVDLISSENDTGDETHSLTCVGENILDIKAPKDSRFIKQTLMDDVDIEALQKAGMRAYKEETEDLYRPEEETQSEKATNISSRVEVDDSVSSWNLSEMQDSLYNDCLKEGINPSKEIKYLSRESKFDRAKPLYSPCPIGEVTTARHTKKRISVFKSKDVILNQSWDQLLKEITNVASYFGGDVITGKHLGPFTYELSDKGPSERMHKQSGRGQGVNSTSNHKKNWRTHEEDRHHLLTSKTRGRLDSQDDPPTKAELEQFYRDIKKEKKEGKCKEVVLGKKFSEIELEIQVNERSPSAEEKMIKRHEEEMRELDVPKDSPWIAIWNEGITLKSKRDGQPNASILPSGFSWSKKSWFMEAKRQKHLIPNLWCPIIFQHVSNLGQYYIHYNLDS